MKKIKKYLLALLISMAFIPTVMAASKYTVKFNANGGKGATSKVTCTVNKKCKLTKNKFTKAGYTFTGWNTKKDGSGKSYKNSAKVKNLSKKGTITLYAQWKANKYTIKFNGNGATSGSTKKMTATYGKKVTLKKNGFKRTYYTFTGWNTKKNGTGKLYKNESSVKNLVKSGTITLYAQWKKNNKNNSKQKAIDLANDYLEFMSFSKKSLIKQLKYSGISESDANYAVENINVNWKKQALKKANDYLDTMAFSKKSLTKQLEYEQFTDDEVKYAIENISVNWKKQALKKANDYLDTMPFSEKSLTKQLEYEGFTESEIKYAINNVVLNSKQQALQKAKDYLDTLPFSEKSLTRQLEYEGFNAEDIIYVFNNLDVDWIEQAAKKAQSYLDLMDLTREQLIEQLIYEGFSEAEAEYGVSEIGL